MRRAASVLLLALGPTWTAVPASSQEASGFLLLETEPGYLTNAYLDPGFPVWDPEVEAGFGALGATGLLDWTGEEGSISVTTGARWTAFTDSTDAWQTYRLGVQGERSLTGALGAGLQLSLAEFRQTTDQRAVWLQGRFSWTLSPGLRLSAGPGVAFRRFPEVGPDGGPAAGPPEGPPGQPPVPSWRSVAAAIRGSTAADGGSADASSVLGHVGMELWAGSGWRLEGRILASHTEADELGLEYRGLGGTVRAKRWLPGGGSLGVGAGIEGFGYRAATAEIDESSVPEGDLLWSGELSWTRPLGDRTELRARVAALGSDDPADPTAGGAVFDFGASAGLRVTLGGRLGAGEEREPWRTTERGALALRVPYEGQGRLYLVGDFNGWSSPGMPLRPVDDGVRGATLELDPGVYRYRLRLVDGDEERWFPLPAGVDTEPDGFGGVNGVLVVGPRREDADGNR